MTRTEKRTVETYLMLKKLRGARLYEQMPNVKARNERELRACAALLERKPRLLREYTEDIKPTRIYRRKDMAAWQMRIVRNKKLYIEKFVDRDYGSKDLAFKAAEKRVDILLRQLDKAA